jgi:hypothetical protein
MINNKYHLSDSLYQISRTPDNQPMYFFFLGMALIYSPFFFIGHFVAWIFGFEMDGFSIPYQMTMVSGAILYTALGLWFFRKWLLLFFSEKMTALLMFLLVLGTNFIEHGMMKNLETVNFLFTGSALVFYYSHKIHHSFHIKYAMILSGTLALMALIKPSEIVFVLVPILWGIGNYGDLKNRFSWFRKYLQPLIYASIFFIAVLSIQFVYFYIKTGSIYYDSYINPGVGIDWKHPHLFESLFSYRKGWLLYTPIMILMIIGWFRIALIYRKQFMGWLVPFCLAYFIICSWTEYWYGSAFSNRPVIAWYPILFLAIGEAIRWFWSKRFISKALIASFLIFCVFLNCFQFWQLNNGILDPYRTTEEYYWKSFLKTKQDGSWDKLKLVNRSFSGVSDMMYPQLYQSKKISSQKLNVQITENEYKGEWKMSFSELTSKDHAFIKLSFNSYSTDTLDLFLFGFVKGVKGAYGGHYFPLSKEETSEKGQFEFSYLTPEMRNREDSIVFYFYNPEHMKFSIDALTVELMTRE